MAGGNIQTTYGAAMAVALPGLRHSEEGLFTSKIAEGDISFGLGVKRGTDPDTQAIVGGGSGFIGIAMHSVIPEAAYADATINIESTETFEVLRGGGICWVSPTNQVVAGDGLVIVDATGAFKGGTAGAGESQLDGNFESSCSANGFAKVMLNSNDTIQFVTATASLGAKSFVKSVAAATFTPLVAANGKKNYVYQVKTGTLPPGLYLNPGTGAVTGIPLVEAAATTVVFCVKDALGNEAATTASIAITITAS